MSIISKKVCLVGDFGVGKTSLIRQFVDRQFSDQYLSTVGVKISRKAIDVLKPKSQLTQSLQLLIWDLEGNTKFKAITPSHLQGAAGVIIVGDVTRSETLDHLSGHIQSFLAINSQGAIVLALNKSDLIQEEDLDVLLKRHYGDQPNLLGIYPTSAKTGNNVNQIFEILSQKLVESL